MLYFSEILNKCFKTEEDLFDAETSYKEKLKKKEEEEKESKKALSNEKKQYAKAVENADEKIDKARADLIFKREQAKKILDEAKERVNKELLIPAENELKSAQKEKYKAIEEYNKKFGVYTSTYTGEKAYNELKKNFDLFDVLTSWF